VATDDGISTATRFYVNGLEPVVTVETGRGHQIQGTPQHRIKVVDPATGAWEWKRFGEVGEGDLVPLAFGQLIGEPADVVLPPLPEAYWSGEHHADVTRTMTPALAELVGYFMGNGSLHSRGLRFRVSAGDDDVVEWISYLGKAALGLQADVVRKDDHTVVRFDSVRLALWWEACGFAKYPPVDQRAGGGPVAHIPDSVLHANDPAAYGSFVRGLFEAAGDVVAGYPSLTSRSVQLVHDVQSLLLALGYPTTLNTSQDGAELRLLSPSYNARWLGEIGFMSYRKNDAVSTRSDSKAEGRDRIPVSRELVERLAVADDRLRRTLLHQLERGKGVTRIAAAELFERTEDPELGHLLSFAYDRVSSASLGQEEFTYDLSVPDNVTYVANGFISHNTIGLLMDCDTTGIEPDLGLVKTKKLVGGGTMSIVNQTVPRALRRLGYSKQQIDSVISYIDKHKTMHGAPDVRPEDLPVFACSMGDNVIHFRGHIRMMGAVQPWISGAISKTINAPEEATIEDIEQVYIESWELGLKAVAVYRDNCKVAQPLATSKKAVAEAHSPAEAHDAELALKVAELEKALERQTVVVKQPIRERLPRKRRSSTFKFRVADCEGYVTVGEYEDGRPGELFIKVAKQGSTLAGIMDSFAISVSLGLQHGVPLSAFVKQYVNVRFEPAGMTDDPDLRIAASLVDYIFRRMAVDYLPYDERSELGILTTGERLQPTLPGVEEMATPSSSIVEARPQGEDQQPPRPAATQAVLLPRASDAPYCYQCGIQMQRAGSCFACSSCGTTSGCS
jgi:ribonucleoside-diphosphate reductase alpha chain